MTEETFLIAGLGNPGARYKNTRHNVGFQIIDAIAREQKLSLNLTKWEADYCRASLWGARVFLIKPQTFMNLSGKSVARFADFFKINPDHILVIHDDIDMHSGRLKLVAGGGPGGHNGIRSLIQLLGTRDFFRLKYGIGRPGKDGIHAAIPVERFVLSSFSDEELSLLNERISVVMQGVDRFVAKGSQKAMDVLNVIK